MAKGLHPGSEGGTPNNGLYGEARLKRVLLSDWRYMYIKG